MKRIASALLICTLLSASSLARAQSLAESLSGEARTEYEAGRNLLEIHDNQGAYLKFKHASDLSSDPRLLWNMAICQKEMHHYAKAVVLVERYLRDGGDKMSAETRQTAVATRNALKGLYSTATLVDAPAGASVFVDNEKVGVTPMMAPLDLDVGSHQIRLEHPDYELAQYALEEVAGGKPLTVNVKMKSLTEGQLHIFASPGDTIVVDGTVVGSERWDGNVKPGRHTVKITALKKKTYEAAFDMQTRGNKTIQTSLQDDSNRGSIWPWVVGGAVLVAGASVGGYFIFKQDDKPGTYTQGGLATIMLPARFR